MYKALIIGAGAIAGGYDSPANDAVLTHAHAYTKNPKIELLGFYDIDSQKAEIAAAKWGVKAYKELVNADIISICVPDEYHTETVLKAVTCNPKVIFLEKPICRDKSEFEILKKIKTPILVNYSRSFSKDFQNLKNRIKSGEFGEYQCGSALYGKGFLHNGSHLINLLNLLIGKIVNIEVFEEIADFYEDDKTKSAILTFDNGKKITFNGCDCRNYEIFELDLIFDKKRIRIIDLGYKIEIYELKGSEIYSGYKNLYLKETIDTDLDFAMLNSVENIVDFLEGKSNLLCTIDDGYEAIKYG